MHEAVRRLAEATGWTGRSYVDTDWNVVHAKLGFELPSDYRDLHAVFPPGSFCAAGVLNGVMVQPPYRVDGEPDLLHQFEVEAQETEDWRREHPEDVPEGMVPWARGDREGLFWVRRSPDPEQWTVAVSSAGIWGDDDAPVVEEFDCGAAEFLLGFVTGRLHSRVLGPVEPDGGAAGFRPIDEAEWLGFCEVSSPTLRKVSLPARDGGNLAEVLGWSGTPKWLPDWDVAERLLGLALPGDYKELLSTVPVGVYAGTVLLGPPTPKGHQNDLLAEHRAFMSELRTRADDLPYAVFPELPGLLPWAEFSHRMAGELFWLADEGDPDSWPVVVRGADGNWEEFDVGVAAFLAALVRDELPSELVAYKPGAPAYRTLQDLPGAPSNTGS
ncbi:SMI1/KNR4 family protein [Lentzea fradiae]|uniref:SMI1/KNR4 family protein n=1 Tax=Lentzea fradiae TaxID=200378 RepID=UPI00115FD9A5|nr:SMI1/KNR4 family protein [Lentzea fradiae]